MNENVKKTRNLPFIYVVNIDSFIFNIKVQHFKTKEQIVSDKVETQKSFFSKANYTLIEIETKTC